MTQQKKVFKSMLVVSIGRGSTLLSNVAVGFLLPRSLGVTGYAFFRIFALYFTYTSLLHLGFIDGVLQRFAGREYDSLDKKAFRGYTRFFVAMQLVVAVILMIVSVFLSDKDYAFIIMMIGIDTFLNSLTLYYMYISQATKRFKEYSVRSIVSAIVKLFLVVALYLIYLKGGSEVSYRIYLIALVSIDLVLLCWYVYTYRDLTFGPAAKLSELKDSIKDIFKTGFVLMIAYQVAHLVFVLDNQFINVFYDTDTFGIYAFSYSIITAFLTLIASISTVLLPMLKSLKAENAMSYFDRILVGVTCLSGLAMGLMYPLDWFIRWFLPQYTESLGFLRIVMPSLMLSTCISIVMFTFYKVLEMQRVYLYVGIGALAVGFVTNSLAQWIWGTPSAISWASVVTLIIWYCMAAAMFVKSYGHRPMRNIVYILLIGVLFYAVSFSGLAWWLATLIYTAAFAVLTLAVYHSDLRALISRRRNTLN